MLEKKLYTKSQIVEKLGVQPYIMALWEKQFGIQTTIIDGEATYTHEDLAKLSAIKELLYEKGFSIDVAKKYIYENPLLQGSSIIAASPLLFESKKNKHTFTTPFLQELIRLRQQLIKLRSKL